MTNQILHIYRRVSTDQQEEDGYGLETQLNAGKDVAENLGFDYKLWDEGAQSSTKSDLQNRPVLTELLQAIDEGEVEHLYAYNQDRLSRNNVSWYFIGSKLIEAKVKLYGERNTVPKDLSNSQDAFMFGILREVSVLEQSQRMSRLSAGKLGRVKSGKWHGGPTVYGYKIDSDGFLKKDPKEAKWIKFIFEQYVAGRSVDEISLELFKSGVLTRRKKTQWSGATIRNVISKTNHYAGFYYYTHGESNETVRVDCDPIVGKRLFNKARKLFAERSYNAKGRIKDTNLKHPTLLKDFLVCGHCGTRFGQKVYAAQYRSHYYCRANEKNQKIFEQKKKIKCKPRLQSMKIETADEVVWNAIIDVIENSHLFKETVKNELLSSNNYALSSEEIVKTKRQIKKLQKQVREVDDLIIGAKAMSKLEKTEGETDRIRFVWEEQREKWLEELKAKQQQLLNAEGNKKWIDWVDEFERRMADLRNKELAFDVKKSFVTEVIETIEVHNTSVGELDLRLKFKLPYVGDKLVYKERSKKKKVYDVENGIRTLSINDRGSVEEKK